MEPTFGVKSPRDYYLYWGVVSAVIALVMYMASQTQSMAVFAAVSLISFAIHLYRRSKAK